MTWLGAQPIKEPGARGAQEVGQALCSRLSQVFEWGVFAGFCATQKRGISRGVGQSPSSLQQSVVYGRPPDGRSGSVLYLSETVPPWRQKMRRPWSGSSLKRNQQSNCCGKQEQPP